jgi:hypothetical protein
MKKVAGSAKHVRGNRLVSQPQAWTTTITESECHANATAAHSHVTPAWRSFTGCHLGRTLRRNFLSGMQGHLSSWLER